MEHETQALLVAAERARLLESPGQPRNQRSSTPSGPGSTSASAPTTPSPPERSSTATTPTRLRQPTAGRHRPHQRPGGSALILLPSGLRLVPIETVAAVVVVKLTLTEAGRPGGRRCRPANGTAQSCPFGEQPVGSPGFGGGHSNSAHARGVQPGTRRARRSSVRSNLPTPSIFHHHRHRWPAERRDARGLAQGDHKPEHDRLPGRWMRSKVGSRARVLAGFAWWFKGTRPFSRSHRASEQPSATTSRVPRGFRRPAGDTIRCRRSTTG